MDALTIAAASGIQARLESLEMLANNVANQATAGYKPDREFYGIFAGVNAPAEVADSTLPVIERQWTDFGQGPLTPTGNPLDLALSGTGFFHVNGPTGELYTRNGHFQLSPDGALQTAEGFAVLDIRGEPIVLDPSAMVEISQDGTVIQARAPVGQLAVVEFDRQEALTKTAGTYFRSDSAQPVPANGAEVHQGKLESANFGAAEAAVRLVSVMRQFEMLQKAVQLGSQMNQRAVDEVAKVAV